MIGRARRPAINVVPFINLVRDAAGQAPQGVAQEGMKSASVYKLLIRKPIFLKGLNFWKMPAPESRRFSKQLVFGRKQTSISKNFGPAQYFSFNVVPVLTRNRGEIKTPLPGPYPKKLL